MQKFSDEYLNTIAEEILQLQVDFSSYKKQYVQDWLVGITDILQSKIGYSDDSPRKPFTRIASEIADAMLYLYLIRKGNKENYLIDVKKILSNSL